MTLLGTWHATLGSSEDAEKWKGQLESEFDAFKRGNLTRTVRRSCCGKLESVDPTPGWYERRIASVPADHLALVFAAIDRANGWVEVTASFYDTRESPDLT